MRENPVPTILGALGLGIAIGLAIRYAAPSERKREIVVGVTVGKIQLERSFAAVSVAAVQIGPGKIERCYAERR